MTTRNSWIVGIDAGHGGNSTGATNPDAPWNEADFNISLARELKRAIEWSSLPFEPFMVRTRHDETVGLSERGERTYQAGCDLVLHLHVNAARDTSLHGGLLFHWPGNGVGQAIGNQIARSLPATLHRQDAHSITATQKATTDDDWLERPRAVMEPHSCTSILVEVGYMSNLWDLVQLQDQSVKKGLVYGILCGLCEHARACSQVAP